MRCRHSLEIKQTGHPIGTGPISHESLLPGGRRGSGQNARNPGSLQAVLS